MTGLTVLAIVLVGLRLVALVVQLAAARAPSPGEKPAVRMDPCLGPFAAVPAPSRSPEGDLAAGLIAGTISRRSYQQTMARLAGEDADHPLALPDD